jgi:hypothetical protein
MQAKTLRLHQILGHHLDDPPQEAEELLMSVARLVLRDF